MNDATLASDNYLLFSHKLLERMQKLIMTNYDRIKDEALQFAINGEAAKISTLPSGKIDKYDYFSG